MTVPYGYVQFDTAEATVLCRLGDGRPQLTGRPGGWEEVARRRRVSTTQWAGHGLWRMAVPVLLDGWRTRTDMRSTWARLQSMGVRPQGGAQPLPLAIVGNVPGTSLKWVVESIDPGDAITGTDGSLLRQAAVVNLLEYNPASIVVRKTKDDGKPAHYTLHTVTKGQTLAKLAASYYGAASKWKAIRDANPDLAKLLRDPSKALPVGKVLRIP